MLTLLLTAAIMMQLSQQTDRIISLNGEWKIWFDRQAEWNSEKVYLQPERIEDIATYPPSIGWDEMLKEGQTINVPSAWEEIKPEYDGVAWYWRTIKIPDEWKNRVIRVRFGAVRHRAEVYVNGKLAGYNMEGSTPFSVDITEYVEYGKENLLAVRVTDPGGGISWMDTNPIRFSSVRVPDSHNFGGIWQDVDLYVTEETYIEDVFVQPQEDLKTINIITSLVNRGNSHKGQLDFVVYEREGKKTVAESIKEIKLPENGEADINHIMVLENPELWSPDNPFLYYLEISLQENNKQIDKESTVFGVRFFTEKDGNLYLNNRRVFVKSAISWGHYPKTIAYPSRELAVREIKSAKALGLNTLSAHRCCITPELLKAADEYGLMISQEPGGAPRDRAPKPVDTAEEFERELFLIKLEKLAKRDRNHPSLVWWNCVNEASKDDTSDPKHLKPYIDRMMKLLHKTDPSRLKSYTSAWRPTCMFRPYEDNYSLLMDMHTVLNLPAVWRDHLYREHVNFSPPRENMVFYNGESRCFTALSDLPAVVKKYGDIIPGSDGAQVKKWLDILGKNFDRFGLEEDFGTLSEFCRETGIIQGFGFAWMGEALRMNPAVDGFAYNGWHCHHVLGTSGMVDIFRNPKFNPELTAKMTSSVHLAGIPLPSTAYIGQNVSVEQILVNEGILEGEYKVEVEAVDPSGKIIFRNLKEVTISGDPDVFVYNLGKYKVKLEGKNGYFHIISRLIKDEKKILEDSREIFAWNREAIKLPEKDVEFIDPAGHLEDYLDSRNVFWHEFFNPVPPEGKKLIICNNVTLKENFEFFLNEILDRTKDGYTDILLANPSHVNAEKLLEILKSRGIVPENSEIILLHGHWLGGWEFVKRSHLFYELPNPAVLNWEYEGIFAPWGLTEFDGEIIAGLCNAPPEMGVTAGVTTYGKGKITFCNFRLVDQLGKNPVADLIFSRFVEFGLEK